MGSVKSIMENKCNFQKCMVYIELTFVKKLVNPGFQNSHTVYIAYSITKDKDTVTVVIWNTIWDRTLSTNNK